MNHYAKLVGMQKDMKYYDTSTGEIYPRHLVTCMAPREAGVKGITIMQGGRRNYLLGTLNIGQ